MPHANPPAIGGTPRLHSGESNKPITRVVVHSAVIPCEPGRARQLAEMNRAGSTGGSWHYATDPEHTYQCSWDKYVCWHAPPNDGSLGIEMADWPAVPPTLRSAWERAKKSWRWRRENHKKMLRRTARLVAELCVDYDLPPRYVPAKVLRVNRDARGWTTHRQVSLAFGQSSHWDPGFWPRRRFARLVREHHARLTNG
jgi:hypothetical protein